MPHPQRQFDMSRDETPAAFDPARLKAANIHPETLLATDYLNHFNEPAMLIELSADMPECLDDLAAWAPLTYREHYARSNYRERALTLEAYEAAPPHLKAALDRIVAELNRLIGAAAAELGSMADVNRRAFEARRRAEAAKALIAEAAGLMNRKAPDSAQDDIDALMAP